ncbi:MULTISPECIES: hypothetical protein [unclassified Bradyrhizobium]|uniref:hypothetical protein n=1 Tax=unclassified Bradyrhizobium TaxID=2631580 RepID=UPI002916B9D3|nr:MULTISPECIES: hypothetical protein [unclassified Bradyrhizobium]
MKALVRLALAGLFALVITQANATVVIKNDPGGKIVDFIDKYSRLRASGEAVVIDGDCASACTMLLGMLPTGQFCGTKAAAFGFHTATSRWRDEDGAMREGHAVEMSALMWNMYPPRVRKLVKVMGWNGDQPEIPHPDVVWVKGANVRLIARGCTGDDLK